MARNVRTTPVSRVRARVRVRVRLRVRFRVRVRVRLKVRVGPDGPYNVRTTRDI